MSKVESKLTKNEKKNYNVPEKLVIGDKVKVHSLNQSGVVATLPDKNGNVTVKGQVFIAGDEAGSDLGQTALLVKDGTVNLEDNAVLVTYGGGGNVLLYAEGGSAIELDNGNITGNGKVVAIGGDVLWGNGGNAVIGNGMITTSEAFLQGATSRTSKNATPGNAISENVKVTSANRHIENGTQIGNDVNNDPLEELYYRC